MATLKLPKSGHPRILILGAGFAGLKLASKLARKPFQVVIIDRNNFHQFQPLFYQVATAGLAPSAIAFPVRKAFHKVSNVHFRMAEVLQINAREKTVETSIGEITYDRLVIAVGADTNYFNNKEIEQHALPMKSVQESLQLRNRILECIENALVTDDPAEQQELLNIVVVGGGPTGTEVSGALSEMKRYVLPSDYPELDFSQMRIHLVEASPKLLNGMSEKSSQKAAQFLKEMGVEVRLNAVVEKFDGHQVRIKGGEILRTQSLIWAAGVKGNPVNGIDESCIKANGRVVVDQFHRVVNHEDIYAIGDIALMTENEFERGHPQVAQAAIQQAASLAKNLISESKGQLAKPFSYRDLGAMATIGRNKAVVDLPYLSFSGFFAWSFWLFVHLMAILGVKNKIFVFLEWMWSYITFDQSLRLVIKAKRPAKP